MRFKIKGYILKGSGLLAIVLLSTINARSQSVEGIHYSAETQVTVAGANTLPFWFRSGQHGSIPLNGTSAGFIGSAYKDYDNKGSDANIDWAAGLQMRVNAGQHPNANLIEGFVKAKANIFQVSVGRTKDIVGLVDSTLSSGAFSISGNALGIPKIGISIPNYYSIPIWGKLFAFKGDYQFGFVGNVQLSDSSGIPNAGAYYQENSVYVRLGQPHWRIKFFGGINHNVMSGHEREILGPGYTLSPLKSLFYAAIGKTFKPQLGTPNFNALTSKVGNHIGSIDLGLEYDFDEIHLMAYRQNLYDVGAISKLANIADGINGISITNKSFDQSGEDWHKIVVEFIYTEDQAGRIDSKITNSSDEDYYNNYVYVDGWTYKGLNLGNPLLTTRQYARTNLPTYKTDYFINNRVMAFYGAFEGAINNINFLVKATYSQNFGTYGTSPEGHNLDYYKGKGSPGALFGMVEQFSGYIEAGKNFGNGWYAGGAVAADFGGLLYNSTGIQLRLKKTFN